MSLPWLGALALIGVLTTGFAAAASKALHDCSRRELEIYCRRRRRTDRFREVLDGDERAALGLESLQIVGTVILMIAVACAATQPSPNDADVEIGQFVAAAVVATFALLAITMWIPTAVLKLWAAPLIYHSWPLLKSITTVVWPLTIGVSIANALLRRLASEADEQPDEEDEFDDEIRSIVTEGLYDGVLEEEEREMIEGVIELGDTDASDIMTPRSNVDCFDVNLEWSEVLSFVIEAGRTRVPAYEQTLDNVIGILYVKDLLRELSTPAPSRKTVRELLRTPCFVPNTKPIDDLLQEFLQTRNHLAIVVDEYRSVAGVVTIEDVLEEIVGEIVDESDQEADEEFHFLDPHTAELLGTVHVDVLNERLDLDLPEPEEYDTVAGLMIAHLGHIPKCGESVVIAKARFTVLAGSRRRVERVRAEVLAASGAESTSGTGRFGEP